MMAGIPLIFFPLTGIPNDTNGQLKSIELCITALVGQLDAQAMFAKRLTHVITIFCENIGRD